jgi:isopropylmalate/homocitrate/citramalate synthase
MHRPDDIDALKKRVTALEAELALANEHDRLMTRLHQSAERTAKTYREALEEANRTLVAAFQRIHTLPRTSDDALASKIEKTRAEIARVLSDTQPEG